MDYKINEIVCGKVTGIEDYGFFVILNDNITTGLVHISEISNSFVRNVSDYVKIGDMVYVKIIGIDTNNNTKLRLSIKDIDYKENCKNKHGIVETKSGFTKLKSSLSTWIEEKEQEINKKS